MKYQSYKKNDDERGISSYSVSGITDPASPSFRHILQVSNAIPRRNQRKMIEEFLQGRRVKELLSSSVYYGTLLVNQSPIGRKILRKKKKTC